MSISELYGKDQSRLSIRFVRAGLLEVEHTFPLRHVHNSNGNRDRARSDNKRDIRGGRRKVLGHAKRSVVVLHRTGPATAARRPHGTHTRAPQPCDPPVIAVIWHTCAVPASRASDGGAAATRNSLRVAILVVVERLERHDRHRRDAVIGVESLQLDARRRTPLLRDEPNLLPHDRALLRDALVQPLDS